MTTKIPWTDETWNIVTGCTPISAGCRNCYARSFALRLAGRFGYPEAPHNFDVTFHPDKLDRPLRWKKPRRIFVCSMSDLFHKDVPFDWIDRVWRVMDNCAQHTFQILTKRPGRALEYWRMRQRRSRADGIPFSNVWLGVTAENQEQADKRIPLLLRIPAAVHFVSIEPMLGPVGLEHLHCGLSWCIIGCETGHGARPMDNNWVRKVIQQCKQFQIPIFYKQQVVNGKKVEMPELDGKRYAEFPSQKES